jgi:hypothetical protein
VGGYKVRLGDGSEIGPMDLSALKTWKLQGLIDGDSPVMRPGSRKWIPLGSLPEFKSAKRSRGSSRPRRGGRRPGSASATTPDGDFTVLDEWRIRVTAGLLVALAAGLGLLAWRPEAVLPAFDGAPWLEMSLGALALGLALLPGRKLGRWTVRALLLLAAFAIFPLAGILVAQGERGAALLALASAWILLSGLVALLARSLGWLGVVLAALPVAVGAFGVAYFGRAPESETAQLVRSWSAPEPRFADDTIGLTLDLPDGWVVLRPGNPLVAAPEEALVTIAQPRLEGYGYVVAEPAPWGVATPDQYLDHVMTRRQAERPSIQEQGRANAILGSLAGRRLDATWTEDDTLRRDLTVAGQDGWMSFALVAWMPEATASRPAGLAPLAGALKARGFLAPRLAAAVQAAVEQVPHLSPPVAELLMAQTEARLLEPEQAFRRSVVALAELVPSLSAAESRELSGLTRATYQGVPRRSRGRLARYIEQVRHSATTDPALDREMAELMKAAELRLAPDRLQRLQEYYERAVEQVSSVD